MLQIYEEYLKDSSLFIKNLKKLTEVHKEVGFCVLCSFEILAILAFATPHSVTFRSEKGEGIK